MAEELTYKPSATKTDAEALELVKQEEFHFKKLVKRGKATETYERISGGFRIKIIVK